MPYFPQSQIKPNLYTNGNEYILSTTKKFYTGYYYEISNGKKYTGKSPSTPPNILLEPPQTPLNPIGNGPDEVEPIQYLTDNSYPFPPINLNRLLPSPTITLPTEQDYKNGRMIRYFAKKTNELRYLEISKQTFTDLNSRSSTIAWDLYEPVQIYWIISGFSKQQVNDYNTLIIRDIEQKRRWYGFSKFLKEDYTKYYKNLSS